MVDETRPDGVHTLLAGNLRRLRIARHLSLSELARGTGMSKATLSSIENGRANPTVETLAALAAALGVALTELLEEPPVAEIRVVRAASPDGSRRLATGRSEPPDGVPQRLIDTITGGDGFEFRQLELAAEQSREAAPRPIGSRAHLFITAGKLIAGPVERSTELGPGDYASFPTDVPHIYQTGRHPAEALLIAQRPARAG